MDKTQLARLQHLEQEAKQLETKPGDRQQYTEIVNREVEKFYDGLENSTIFTEGGDKASSAILANPITEEGSRLEDILETFRNSALKSGLQAAHPGHLAYVPGGGLYPAALGDYLTAVTNKYAGVFALAPDVVRLENMLIDWVAGLFGYPSGHAGNLTSGGTSATLIAIATARDSMQIKPSDYERAVVYVTQVTHNCIAKSMAVLGMRSTIMRHIPLKDMSTTMDVQQLKARVNQDKKDGLLPFLVVASLGTGITGSVDPIHQIADVAEEYNLWLHVDAAYGGFFVLVDDVRHHFEGVERSDSIVVDPHKGLFLPYGSGILLVRDGYKLFQANSISKVDILQDLKESPQLEYSPCDLSFELTKHSRGLRMWLPLKLFGVRLFASALEEKLLLARYFHHKISAMEGFVAKPAPVLSIVVFYYDAKDKEKTDKFNRELQKRIIEDGRVYMSSVNVRGIYHLRICVLNFRTHRKHIDLCLEIIAENAKLLKTKFACM
ncbi:uncharacterized protein LOC144449811 [Glandiceps talaboti]